MDLVSTLSGDRRVAREAALGVWRLRAARAAVLGLAAALRLWRIDQNGLGTDYYSAAVRSMMTGWHAFFYNAFDPAGFVSVDKPPLALWIQVASAWVLGFDGLAVLLPQVIEGVAAVWLVAHLVERRFGAGAGLLAGLFLAITPVSVAADRSSNTDSCLVLALLLAAWALARAAEDGRRDLLLLSMALLGLAFNVKMLAAFVVLPTFVLIMRSGEPVMARGGVHGLDPILTPEKLAGLVESRQVRFATVNDLSMVSRRVGADAAGRPLADWIRANGKPVDLALWRVPDEEGAAASAGPPRRGARLQLYDLRPDLPLVPPRTGP